MEKESNENGIPPGSSVNVHDHNVYPSKHSLEVVEGPSGVEPPEPEKLSPQSLNQPHNDPTTTVQQRSSTTSINYWKRMPRYCYRAGPTFSGRRIRKRRPVPIPVPPIANSIIYDEVFRIVRERHMALIRVVNIVLNQLDIISQNSSITKL